MNVDSLTTLCCAHFKHNKAIFKRTALATGRLNKANKNEVQKSKFLTTSLRIVFHVLIDVISSIMQEDI